MSTAKVVTVVHPSATVNNIVNDASGNVAIGNNLTVAGAASVTGAATLAATTATSLSVGGVAAVAVAPSTAGNVLTSTGSAWASTAPSSPVPTPSAIGQIPFSTNGSTYAATQKIVRGTAVASTSGTSIDFTSIPSWVKRVIVVFNGVSTNGAVAHLIQAGTGGVPTTSGYVAAGSLIAAGVATVSSTAGFPLYNNLAAYTNTGTISLVNMTGNTWVASGTFGNVASTPSTLTVGGSVTLAGVLDMVRITTANGTDTFDAGSINILYE